MFLSIDEKYVNIDKFSYGNYNTNGPLQYIKLTQNTICSYDPVIFFGPMSIKLSHLFSIGYILNLKIDKYKHRCKLYLSNSLEGENYKIGVIYNISQAKTLCQYVKNELKILQTSHNNTKIVEKYIEPSVEDSLKILKQRYPVKPKINKNTLIGNMTLKETIKYKLKELG